MIEVFSCLKKGGFSHILLNAEEEKKKSTADR